MKMKVEELCARMDLVQQQLRSAADTDERCARLEVCTRSSPARALVEALGAPCYVI